MDQKLRRSPPVRRSVSSEPREKTAELSTRQTVGPISPTVAIQPSVAPSAPTRLIAGDRTAFDHLVHQAEIAAFLRGHIGIALQLPLDRLDGLACVTDIDLV